MDYFPLAEPRPEQVHVLTKVAAVIQKGCKHIVIEAPTGSGKSAIGVAIGRWAMACSTLIDGVSGAWYLTGQKLLQDQLEADFVATTGGIASVKSAVSYSCLDCQNCALGRSMKNKTCSQLANGDCSYEIARETFIHSDIGITNYAYYITAKAYTNILNKRRVLVMDECHDLEDTILNHVEVSVRQDKLETYAPTLNEVPRFGTLNEFIAWIEGEYLVAAKDRRDTIIMLSESGDIDERTARQLNAIEQHMLKLKKSVKMIKEGVGNWIFWNEYDRKNNQNTAIAKPLEAAPFKEPFEAGGEIKVFMSAYPGDKGVFCDAIGLDPRETYWIKVPSSFPPENRKIVLAYAGSMSMRNYPATKEKFIDYVTTVLNKHPDEKGIIHCASYKLGSDIMEAFRNSPHFYRFIYPRNADERANAYRQHRTTDDPMVIISPSFTEGFDFAEDAARWQIIAKVPWPSLGNKQVAEKQKQNRAWYCEKAVKTIIQACGRVCRSATDVGKTYVLDSDFQRLYDQNSYMFPQWFVDAFRRVRSK